MYNVVSFLRGALHQVYTNPTSFTIFVPQEWLADAHRAAVSLHEKGYKTAAMELYRLCIEELEKAHGAAPRQQEMFVDTGAIQITADQSTSRNINRRL